MNAARIACAVCLGGWLGATTAWSQPRYEAIILHSERIPSVRSFGLGIGAGEQVGKTTPFFTGESRALLWRGGADSVVDLSVPGWDGSFATVASGGRQAGYLYGDGRMIAGMWSGTADSFVSLHPDGYDFTWIFGMAGNQQVGAGRPRVQSTTAEWAMLWRGTADSAVLLHLNDLSYIRSRALGTDGEVQVGVAQRADLTSAPVLWRGSADTMVDLTPEGFLGGEAYAAAGGQQVGWLQGQGGSAVIWFGSAENYVILNDETIGGGRAYGTNGVQQVGYVNPDWWGPRASVWTGTRESYHDLHQYLPPAYQEQGGESYARGIDAEGNIIGYAYGALDFRPHAVLWRPVPEPGTLVGLGALLALLAARRRRAKVN